MHRLMAGTTILEHELSELRLLVERQTGILLDCPNSALAAHVAEHLESHELESPAALLERLLDRLHEDSRGADNAARGNLAAGAAEKPRLRPGGDEPGRQDAAVDSGAGE